MKNTINLNSSNEGSFFGDIASKYSYTPILRKRLDEVHASAKNSSNSFFVLEGDIVRAAQSTESGAMQFMSEGRVLVSVTL